MPVNADVWVNYAEREFERGREQGRSEASSIQLGESNYGATQSRVIAVEFTGLRDLIDNIKSRRDRSVSDRPGMAYLWTCELIHIHHNDYNSIALLKCATHWDI